MAEDSAIELLDIHVRLQGPAGEVHILRGLSLRIGVGETVGVVGPSGSGKSTMLMTMSGLERASSGTIRVAGQDLGALSEDGLALFRRDHVGIVFQSFHLIPTMTALENVAVPLELAGIGSAFVRAQAELEAVGLGRRLAHYPGQMSGGEQQRVALARAFASAPAIILADEPTGSLDRETGGVVVELLFARRAATGATLVLITHDRSLAEKCDRVVRLFDGVVEEA